MVCETLYIGGEREGYRGERDPHLADKITNLLFLKMWNLEDLVLRMHDP